MTLVELNSILKWIMVNELNTIWLWGRYKWQWRTIKAPVEDLPEFEAIISVVEVGNGLQASCTDVLRQAEGAVGHLREPPLHDIKLALASKVSGLRGE